MREVPQVGMASLRQGFEAVVVGASGGIGRALTEALAGCGRVGGVTALSRSGGAFDGPGIVAGVLDVEDEALIERAARETVTRVGEVDLVVVASGLLHALDVRPERSYRQMTPDAFERLFRANATGPALVAKHFLDLLPKNRKAVFAAISARVGSIEDNRLGGWHAYRASKAALNMILRCLAVETARRRPQTVVAGLHPGTTATGLSEPFQANVPPEKLFSPAYSAAMLLNVLDRLGPEDSGGLFAYDGERIPF